MINREQTFTRRDCLWLIIPLIIFLLFFGIIFLCHLNQSLFYSLNRYTRVIPWFWEHATLLGDALVLPCLFVVLIRKRPDLVWALLWSAIVATLLVHSLKPILQIPRPAGVLDRDSFTIIGKALKRRSFPSGHTATVFTAASILILTFKNSGIRASLLLIASLVGLSRIMVGAHWPLDVFAGAAAGLIGGLLGTGLSHRINGGNTRTFQILFGCLLLMASAFLTAFYHSGYPGAIWFQRATGIFCLVYGGREYGLLLRSLKGS